MNRTEKEQMVAELHADFVGVQGAIVADYQGLTVGQITDIRRAFRDAGVTVKVIKNSLARIAADGTPLEVIKNDFVGPVAIAYSLEDPVSPAKVAEKCAQDQEKFTIKCGYVDNGRLDVAGVAALSKLPGKDELRSKLLNVLMAPATQLVRTFNAVPQQVAVLLNARKDDMGGESGE